VSGQRIAVAALIKTPAVFDAVDGRVYAVEAPQDAERPYIVARLLSDSDQYILEGAGHWRISRVEVTSIAESATEVDRLGELVNAALGDLRNETFTWNGDHPFSLTVTSEKAGSDYCDVSDDRKVFRRISDYRFNWTGTDA
jgi:hypothetical protein